LTIESNNMEVRIKQGEEMIDATIEMIDDVMVVSPKEVKFEPKDGDVCKSINCIYIFKGLRHSNVCKDKSAIIYHCCYNGDYLTTIENVGVGHISRNQRYATEEEKKLLFDKLAEKELAWDAEKKELVKLKWKPKDDELYCRPGFNNEEFACYKDRWDNTKYENFLYNKGWIFKTEQECQEFCDRLNEAINSVKL